MIEGLSYIEDFISNDDQDDLVKLIDKQPWDLSIKRRTQHYGYRYDYTKKKIDNSLFVGEIPSFLKYYCGLLEEKFSCSPDQIIVNEYYPGQGISRHIDCPPCFGETIASISLLSSCMMEFEQWGNVDKKYLYLQPKSLLILSSDARYKWMHSIPARENDVLNGEILPRERRISLTFRKVILS